MSIFAAALGAAAWYSNNTFYIRALDGEVVIYQGPPGNILWITSKVERQDIEVDDIGDEAKRKQVTDGVDDLSRNEANNFVANLVPSTTTTTTTTTTTSTTTTTIAPAIDPAATTAPVAPG